MAFNQVLDEVDDLKRKSGKASCESEKNVE